ncbi:glutamate-5-semialdehyde dehydrogenase [Pedobacter antarcticus]|uniref:glutamate-5-semialdehyde dehydrogenase n=1 Tax=Pedobacter antarcticus TaxID=34086 RepID=UPI00088093F5|nr:glutamate-5-semialdehyde dehydrogenase [Pedobacter antarcticus]SDL50734.1 glutamate-5-semialdehyde dehydrogenase [Pedobacter antarcticus]
MTQLIMEYIQQFELARESSKQMHNLSAELVNKVLTDLAEEIVKQTVEILKANQLDLNNMDHSDPKYDRLLLNPDRVAAIAADIRNVATLKSPLGEVLENKVMENGLDISKIRVPLGVIGVIYEARPNVTLDVFALCLKTGNVAILKGGKDADETNRALLLIIHSVLAENKVDTGVVTLLPADRKATEELLSARAYVDVIIPRGSQGLIDFVRENSKVPVIETGAGIVHTYFDISGDLEKGKAILFNAKTRRVSVCNSLDCLLIHRERLNDLAMLVAPMAGKDVQLYADPAAFEALKGIYPEGLLHQAGPEDFGTEFLDYKLAIKTVSELDEALRHIASFSSRHSEAIIAEDDQKQTLFLNAVDAAAVYVNASTSFTDGGQFGMGAEIGISTQKLHARGPMGLSELTSYKWIVRGNGQVR